MENTSYKLINDLSFVVFDLETTGGNHKHDKIIEIGLVKIKNLEIIQEKDFLIQPGIPVPKFIQKLTNISTRDLKDAPIIEDLIHEILDFMGDSILVAHNTSFDIPFFNAVLKNLGMKELENKSICTNLMTKHLIPGLMNTNLNYMCEIFHIDHGRAHRALDDAVATAKLLLIFLNSFIERNITKINHLYYPRNRFELARLNFKACIGKNKESENIKLNQKILNKISKLNTFSLITLKGEQGIILFSIVIKGSKNEITLIEEVLSDINWHIVTIKIVGGIIDAYVDFEPLYKKLDNATQEKVIGNMWQEYIDEEIPQNLFEDCHSLKKLSIPNDFGDFLISNNLVADQYSIYPSKFIDKKFKLVFRYPIHQKKLLQYLKSKMNKLKGKKDQTFKEVTPLSIFLQAFLKRCKQNEKDVLFIDYAKVKSNEVNFLKELELFLAEYSNTYKYPKEHI